MAFTKTAIFSTKTFITLFILSAIPIATIISLEKTTPTSQVYQYHSNSWFRECAKWDDLNRRFIVSYIEGGLGEIKVPDDDGDHNHDDVVLDEITTVKDVDLVGNASFGIAIDKARNRVLVAVADLMGNRYSGLAAYDLSSWRRLFLAHLSTPDGEKTMADDVAVDEQGNAYVTDVKASKIWKVNADGQLVSIIRSPLFTFNQWYKNLVALNGIVYHPDDYMIVIHTFSGTLYKIDLQKGDQVELIKIENGSLAFGDGIELISPTKLVVAGNPSARLVESTDGWKTASVVSMFWGPLHRLTTSATVKDGKVYLSHLIGMGYPRRKHVLVEAKL